MSDEKRTVHQRAMHSKLRHIRNKTPSLSVYRLGIVLGHHSRTIMRWLADPPDSTITQIGESQLDALISVMDNRKADTITVVYRRSRIRGRD